MTVDHDLSRSTRRDAGGLPPLVEEWALLQAGHSSVAGLDEAGRGAWAGPVAAAAVILPLDRPEMISQLRHVRDSKLCTPHLRDVLYDQIRGMAVTWAVSLVPASRIDEIGIVAATRQAMREAIASLTPSPVALLIDALELPSVGLYQRSLVKGELKSLSIAAASILAKVTRDRQMVDMDRTYPGYGFAQHKGYGTPEHREALGALGPISVHRWYYAPVAAAAFRRGIDSPHGRTNRHNTQ
jgi:ribonuclease HII